MTTAYNISSDPGIQGNATLATYQVVKNVLFTFIVPVIILTGFIGNTICFIVFVASPLSRISTSAYLAALAFSDTGFLSCLGIGWLEALGIRLFHTHGVCQVTVYASFVFSFTSIWYVNAFTMEMYIAVFHPKLGAKLCVPKTAKIVALVLFLVAATIYIYVFWISRIVKRPDAQGVCMHEADFAMLFSVFDTVLTLIVPFVMIIFMMTRLLLHISKFYKSDTGDVIPTPSASEHVHEPVEPLSSTGCDENHRTRQRTEARTQLTRMLVVTVLVFLIFNLPSHAIKVQFLFRFLVSESIKFTETEGFMQVIFQTLYYSNFSINFLLYSASGKSFRSALSRVSFTKCVSGCRHSVKRKCQLDKNKNQALSPFSVDDDRGCGHREQHSRLVDIHLQDIRESQLPSMESQFVCQSPPCLLAWDSEHQQSGM